jgi:hypothetical protein
LELPARTICREHEFDEQLERLLVNMEEADEFTHAAEIALSLEPTLGLPASRDGKIWVLPMPLVRGRQVTLYYTFDEGTVTFLANSAGGRMRRRWRVTHRHGNPS